MKNGEEVRTRQLSGKSRDAATVDITNGDLNIPFKVTKLTKIALYFYYEKRRRERGRCCEVNPHTPRQEMNR